MKIIEDCILEELKLGKDAALKKLFDTYYIPLCAYSVQFTDSLEVSEDIVQEFFIRFWEKKKYNAISGKLHIYLFNAIKNASLNYIKKERPYSLNELEELSYSPIEHIFDEEELITCRKKLHACLQQLSPQEYKVLIAIVIENKKYKEVAEELGISVNSVKTYFARALKFLRTQKLLNILFLVFY